MPECEFCLTFSGPPTDLAAIKKFLDPVRTPAGALMLMILPPELPINLGAFASFDDRLILGGYARESPLQVLDFVAENYPDTAAELISITEKEWYRRWSLRNGETILLDELVVNGVKDLCRETNVDWFLLSSKERKSIFGIDVFDGEYQAENKVAEPEPKPRELGWERVYTISGSEDNILAIQSLFDSFGRLDNDEIDTSSFCDEENWLHCKSYGREADHFWFHGEDCGRHFRLFNELVKQFPTIHIETCESLFGSDVDSHLRYRFLTGGTWELIEEVRDVFRHPNTSIEYPTNDLDELDDVYISFLKEGEEPKMFDTHSCDTDLARMEEALHVLSLLHRTPADVASPQR